MTDNDPRAALERAAQAAKTLHAASDELSKRLLRFEKLLLDKKIGVAAATWLKAPAREGDDYVRLRFCKHGARWGLFIETGFDIDFGDEDDAPNADDFTPIASANRAHRLLAARALPELVTSIIEAVNSELGEVNDANERVERLIKQTSNGSASEVEG
jgi:hypothetical protein